MKQLDGYFLSFNNADTEKIKQYLKKYDYNLDGEGLKELILDIINSDDEPEGESDLAQSIKSFISENPEILKMAGSTGQFLLNKLKPKR